MKSALGAVLVALACAADGVAATFATNDGFSVVLPADWVEIPPDALREIEATIGALSQGAQSQHYDYGYQLASAQRWFEYPYILVQVRRNGRVPEGELTKFESIQSGIGEGLKQAGESMSGVLSDLKQGEVLYDDGDHVLWSTVAMNVQGVGQVQSLTAVKLTEFGLIQMMGYATEATFAQYAPVFREAVGALVIDEANQYRPRLSDHAPTIGGINLGQTAIAALVGGVAGGVIALVSWWRKKRAGSA